MKLLSNRAGVLMTHQTQYQYFVPTSLYDVHIDIDNEMNDLLSQANYLLGKLDGLSINLPDKDILIAMYVEKEAVLSSQIEGTQCTLDDVLQSKCSNTIKHKDIKDVVNCISALYLGIDMLKAYPISTRYFKALHKVLLDNTRGQYKQPGEIRNSQNWIGPKNSTFTNAIFIPPCVEVMHSCLNDLEKFINDDNTKKQPLINTALIHYQFETIHPFLDGNGRVGRILIPLWLINNKTLNNNLMYLSLYFKQHKNEYYSSLMDVRLKGEYEKWIKFFLKAIIATIEESLDTINKILKLKNEINDQLKSIANNNIKKAIDFIYKQPYFTSSDLRNNIKLSKPTINKIIDILIKLDIIIKKDNKLRNSTYCFSKYVNILKPGTEL